MTLNAHGLVDKYPASDAEAPGSALREDRYFFLLSVFFFLI